ncbi:hypothetical protein J4Q44_G00235110 [Coregonus suidteri]|uniref:Uncharacterized protein n=1 Tax=Coregonus suidteri TaxID=861788 RepID=A0AAN8LRI2_9TELE
MSLRDTTLLTVQVAVMFWVICMFPRFGSSYELQDTIHALKEENVHLHHRLENLTRALRELKHLLLDHSRDAGGQHKSDSLHAWNKWTQHGISPETRHTLEQAFCWPDLHGAASPIFKVPARFLFTPIIVWLSPLLF